MKRFLALMAALFAVVAALFADLRDDETAAESSEVILVLALLVLGLLGVWALFKSKLIDSITRSGNCVQNASTATSC